MTEHTVLHSTFTLERTYPVAPDKVYAAWADPAAKARWFAGVAQHELDFRVGGKELVTRAGSADRPTLTFESVYHHILPNERIVFASTLGSDGVPATVSLTTVQLSETDDGTLLTLTQQGAFLDGQEEPSWREQGTSDQLDALAEELQA